MQIVFQNPDSALNRAAHRARGSLGRSLSKLAGLSRRGRANRLLELTRSVRLADRYLPCVRCSSRAASSSGSRSPVRLPETRALVVCDEPTSALDVSVQAAILNLLSELQRKEQRGLPLHQPRPRRRALPLRPDLRALPGPRDGDRAGRGSSTAPHHPYTEALLSAVPTLDGTGHERIRLEGEIPSPADPPSGCVFHTRCPRKIGEICETTEPPLADAEPGHAIRCHIPLDELRTLRRPRP